MTTGTRVRIITGAMKGLTATAVGPGPSPNTVAVRIADAAGLVGVYTDTDLAIDESVAA